MTTPTRYLRKVSAINDFKHIKKIDRYVVEITCEHREPAEFWMTEKQLSKLAECFGTELATLETPALVPRGRAVFAAFEQGDSRERFIWPAEKDSKWLTEKFGPFTDESDADADVDAEEEAEEA